MSFKSFQEKVYIKHVNSIYRYIFFLCKNREVAEDVTAEAFTRLFERYKKNKSHVHKDIKNTKSYLLVSGMFYLITSRTNQSTSI